VSEPEEYLGAGLFEGGGLGGAGGEVLVARVSVEELDDLSVQNHRPFHLGKDGLLLRVSTVPHRCVRSRQRLRRCTQVSPLPVPSTGLVCHRQDLKHTPPVQTVETRN
jgi:hypothetical protein